MHICVYYLSQFCKATRELIGFANFCQEDHTIQLLENDLFVHAILNKWFVVNAPSNNQKPYQRD